MFQVLIISTPEDTPRFKHLLGDGNSWGLKIEYAIQPSPDGLAQAFIIGEQFLDGAPSVLILGDNIFYGHLLQQKLESANSNTEAATVFAYAVKDPERYGVVEFDNEGKVLSLEEKPSSPKSNYAVTGLYFFDEHAPSYARQLQPSPRGELEITDLNKIYLEKKRLRVENMGRGYTWLDTGTFESLIEAHLFVQTIERRQGLKVSCPEESAYRKGWIDEAALKALAEPMLKNNYGQYLLEVIKGVKYESLTPRSQM